MAILLRAREEFADNRFQLLFIYIDIDIDTVGLPYMLTCYLIQATTSDLRSQITTLQAALEEAKEENAARKEHETILTSQFQVRLFVAKCVTIKSV